MVYEACPLQYHSAFVKGIPPPVTPAMKRGTNIHALIAGHLTKPELLPQEIEPGVLRVLEDFKRSRFNTRPVLSEEAFVLPLERGHVRGRIDVVIHRPAGGLEVVDFKSGVTRSRQELERSLQLPIYTLAVSKLFGARPEDLAYTYYFLDAGVEVSFSPTGPAFIQLAERVEGIMQAIQEKRFERRPGCTCYACRRVLKWRGQRRENR